MILNVWLNERGRRGGRYPEKVELLKGNKKTILVRLPSGRIIKRKRRRDVVA